MEKSRGSTITGAITTIHYATITGLILRTQAFSISLNNQERKNMITLECNYSKKIGLPQYSSHQFSITLRAEIADVSQVQQESARLYRLLQDGVDSSIQEIGYLPGNGNGNGNGHSPVSEKDEWKCSPAQKDLILKIVEEHKLDK